MANILSTVNNVSTLRDAIDNTLLAIQESRQNVENIAESTLAEVLRLEAEFEQLKTECEQVIERVEFLEVDSKRSRERLASVSRDIRRYRESDVKDAYEKAERVQSELIQLRERESHLRFRRDDVARRLKALRVTAQQAEVLMVKFNHVTEYLNEEFTQMSETLQAAHSQSILTIQLLQMQEEERRELARTLHDGPMQGLASAMMRLQLLSQSMDTMSVLDDVRERLGRIISTLREITFQLRPPLLDDLGLVLTVRRYVQHWSHSGNLPIQVNLIGVERTLSPTEKVVIFRSIQEALENVVNHAEASRAEIGLVYAADHFSVNITDDGCGMEEPDWLKWIEDGKLGLAKCRQLLGAMGGTVSVTGSDGGTTVQFRIPFAKE